MLSNKDVLKDKIDIKKNELETKLAQLKADSRSAAIRERDKIQERLTELQTTVKNGWENLSDKTTETLNRWLSKD